MARFEDALPYVLAHEGGWSDDPSDPGGATNRGITLAVFLGLGRDADLTGDGIPDSLDLDRDGDVDVEDLKRLTPELTAGIYKRNYWRFNGVASQAVGTKLFDMAVNMGLKTAIRMAQGCLNDIGATLTLDGVWGPQTEACVNAVERSRMLDLLTWESIHHYQAIAARRPKSVKFLRCWMTRAKARPND